MLQIAVVEDDADIRCLLKTLLGRQGYLLVEAADGQAALTMIETQPPPAALLLDLMLPYYDGFQLVKYVRRHPRWKDVPIVMLSSNAADHNIQVAMTLGANDYIRKPFDPDDVLTRIQRLSGVRGVTATADYTNA